MIHQRRQLFTTVCRAAWSRAALVVIVLMVLQLIDCPPAAADEALWTPGHVTRLKEVVSAAVSPDGKHVAYTLAVPRMPLEEEDGRAWIQLYVVDALGNSRPFITGEVSINSVQWTPDGRSIAYRAKRGDDKHTCIYSLPIDGGESQRMLQHETDVDGMSFAPSDDRIAFLAKEAIPQARQEYREKGFDQDIYEEDWRPTKVWLAERSG